MHYPIYFTQDLKRNPYPGLYIALEGIDGCGKSTQVEKVREYFEKQNKQVVMTSEPQATGEIQKIIRDALFSKVKIPSRGYQNLYSADRILNQEKIVIPALKAGRIVLTHRSLWSNEPYGVLDLGVEYDFSKVWSILVSQGTFSYYHQFMVPDMTFYLKISAQNAAIRLSGMSKKKDIYEKEEKLSKIARGYDTLVSQFRSEFVIIDGKKREDEVTRDIIQKIEKYLKAHPKKSIENL